VGVANIDSFDDYDVLYDFNNRSIQFNPATPPADGALIEITGKYYFPIAVRYKNLTSITAFGERQIFKQDKTIKSRADAKKLAAAELAAYAQKIVEGSFETYEPGLNAGQKITLSLPTMGVLADYVIQRLSGRPVSPDKILWSVELVSVKTFELIDLLAQIIRGKNVESPDDLAVSNAESITRTIAVGREYLSYFNSYPTWVASPFEVVSLADRRRVCFADRKCFIN